MKMRIILIILLALITLMWLLFGYQENNRNAEVKEACKSVIRHRQSYSYQEWNIIQDFCIKKVGVK